MAHDWSGYMASVEDGSGELNWIEARWQGRCWTCKEPYQPGDEIAYSDDDGGWIGRCCDDA